MYRLASPVPDEVKTHLEAYDPLTQTLLNNRRIVTAEAAHAFLNPNFETQRHDPYLLPDMERAVERILRALRDGELIGIYSDYDCDGIPGGALLHDFFSAVPHARFTNYIPHRHEEGYGLNIPAIEKLHAAGVSLVVTVDCGITDRAPVARANELGMDVIVTDHHEPGAELPEAYAVINPKRKDSAYPFAELCGTGVAFKLVEALLARKDFDFNLGQEKWWLDVVGIATIADMVPLIGENRVLARYGLTVLKKTRRPGLQQLLRTMRINPRYITEDDIGFMIAPRINAASRMDNPEDAFRMLTTKDEGDAGGYAKHLEKVNNERKGVVASIVKDIKKRIAAMGEMHNVLVMGNPLWRPALVGLAANTLAEEYRRPVFIWGRDGREVIKGSCRSGGEVSVVSLMHEVKDVLIEYGGHHASGGFSVHHDHIHTFEARLNDALPRVQTAVHDDVDETMLLDADLSLSDVTEGTFKKIDALAPFGMGNAKPLFRFRDVVPERVEAFGKTGDHIRATFTTPRGTLEAISFFGATASYRDLLETGKAIDLIAHIEKSFFMNRPTLRLRIVDVVQG